VTTSLGSLIVTLGAETAQFVSGVGKALESTEKFLRGVKKMSNEVAGFSATLTGMSGAAVALAASVDDRANASMQRLKDSTALVAVQVSDVLAPSVAQVSGWFGTLAAYVAGLTEEQKKSISHWEIMAVEIGVAAKSLGLISSLAEQTVESFGGMMKVFSGVTLGGLLTTVAVLAAIVAAVVAVRIVWRKWGDDIKEAGTSAIESLATNWGSFFSWMSDSWTKIQRGVLGVADALGAVLEMNAKFSWGIGAEEKLKSIQDSRKAIQSASKMTGVQMFQASWSAGKDALAPIVKGAVDELGIMADEAKNAFGEIRKMVEEIAWPTKGTPRSPHKTHKIEVEVGTSVDAATSAMKLLNDAQTKESELRLAMDKVHAAKMKAVQGDSHRASLAAIQALNRAELDNQAKKMRGLSTAANQIMAASGDFTAVANDIGEGLKAGGIMGLIIAAFVAVLRRTQGFMEFLEQGTRGLDQLGSVLGTFTDAFFKMFSEFHFLLTKATAPILVVVRAVFDPLVKTFKSIMPLIEIFANVIGVVAGFVGSLLDVASVFDVISPALEVAFRGIFWVLQGLVIILTGAKIGFEYMMLGLAEVARAIMTAVAADTTEITAYIDNTKTAIVNDRKKIDELFATDFDATRKKQDADYDAAKATNAATDATNENVAAMRDFGEMLTNVPTGFKVALARMEATGIGDAPGSGGIDFGGAMKSGRGQAGDVFRVDTVIIQTTGDGEETLAAFERAARKKNGQQRGNPEAVGPGQSPK